MAARQCFRLWLGIALMALACLVEARAAAERIFDIPAGPADETLGRFGIQSGSEFIFSPEVVRGVRTHAVKGAYSASDALDAMIAGTPLRRVQHPGSGAISVGRESPAQGRTGTRAARPRAQSEAAETGEAATRLNPFMVDVSVPAGFESTSVGSGTRLAVELRDTPVAYSVVSRGFIDALSITNLAEAAAWGTNQGARYTADNPDSSISSLQYFARGNLMENTGGPFSTGGTTQTTTQRNYYINSNISGDSYAVESYEFGRGPNAPLFGTGNLTGTANLQTKRPRFDRPATSLSLSAGSWQHRRATIDHNRLLGDRVAVRLNAVWMDKQQWRMISREIRSGLTVGTRLRLTDSTELRIDASTDKTQHHDVGTGLVEFFSGWDGATVFAGPITQSMLAGVGSGLTFNGEPQGVLRMNRRYVFEPYGNSVMNYQNYPATRQADSTSRVPLYSRSAPNGSHFLRGTNPNRVDSRLGTDVPFGVNGQVLGQIALPADRFYKALENSRFRMPDERFNVGLRTPALTHRTGDIQLALTQRLGRGLVLDIGGDINRTFNDAGKLHPDDGSIDLSATRPDGSPNPYFLDVFSDGDIGSREARIRNAAARVNLGYFGSLGRFGNHSVNLQASVSRTHIANSDFSLTMGLNPDRRLWNASPERVLYRVYWGDAERAYVSPQDRAVRFVDVDWSDPNVPVVAPARIAYPRRVSTGGSGNRETYLKNRYALVQATSKFFSNRLVFTGVARRDLSTGLTRLALARNGDYPADWDGRVIFRPDAPVDYFSLTYQRRDRSTGAPASATRLPALTRPSTTSAGLTIRDPLYAQDRFRNDYNPPESRIVGTQWNAGLVWHLFRGDAPTGAQVSPYLNYSESYAPPTSAGDLDLGGALQRPIGAHGYDAGVMFGFLDNRIAIKANFYRTAWAGYPFTPATSSAINALYASNRFDDPDQTVSGRNARGVADLPGADYQVRRGEGRELEAWASFNGFRVTANGGWGSNSMREQAPLTRQLFAANGELFQQILEDAGGMLDTSRRPAGAPNAPGLAVPAPAGTFPGAPLIDQTAAVNAYNNAWIAFERLLGQGDSRTPDQPMVNAFADYLFRSGPAAGLRLGYGVQWQGRQAVGTYQNQTLLDPARSVPTAVDDPTVDGSSMFFYKGAIRHTATAGYSFSCGNGREVLLSLRIDNPTNYRAVVYQSQPNATVSFRQPDGDLTKPNRVPVPAVPAHYPEPRSFVLTTTLKL